jgi:choline dehydrogenase-like flavoprotein
MITFDAIVIGVGQTGPFLARRLADAGMRVAVVERGLIDVDTRKRGSTCSWARE